MKKTFFHSIAVVFGCVFLASVVKDVEGLAWTTIFYADGTCQTPQSTGRTFGILPSGITSGSKFYGYTYEIEQFNECLSFEDAGGNTTSLMMICDATTGEYGSTSYTDDTCSEASSAAGVLLPNCTSLLQDACTEGQICPSSSMTECTDDEPSTISPTKVAWVANEYNDADCADPTGNTEILGSEGEEVMDCVKSADDSFFYVSIECFSDGSHIQQTFGPDDDTCSDVWTEFSVSTEDFGYGCSPTQVGGLYYNPISCTTDSATVIISAGTPSPAAITITETLGPVAGLTSDLSGSATPALSSSDRETESTMNSTASIEDTPAPTNAGGAIRVGNGVAMKMGVTLVVGVLVVGMAQSL